AYRDGADPRWFDGTHYFCCTQCTGGKQAGKIFSDWNGWARVSASSSLQRASRSSRRTTGRRADANSIPNAAFGCAAFGCAADNRGATAGTRTADNLRPGSRDAEGCAGCRDTSSANAGTNRRASVAPNPDESPTDAGCRRRRFGAGRCEDFVSHGVNRAAARERESDDSAERLSRSITGGVSRSLSP